MPIPNDTLEIDAQGREALVLDVALPVLTAWRTSVRVVGFRPSMGISGLSPREVARLRTLGLGTAARATNLFDGATDFRFAFPVDPERVATLGSPGVEADLGGHPLAPSIADLSIAAFGLPVGRQVTHTLSGFTHMRGADAQGYAGRTLSRLGREFDLDLKISFDELGFDPQGQGLVSVSEARDRQTGRPVEWQRPGDVRGIHVTIGGVRPRMEQIERIEQSLRESFWDSRRLEPAIERLITPGTDYGTFLQVDVECEFGGATFIEVLSRTAAPLAVARRIVKKVLDFLDSNATFDSVTGIQALTAAIAARGNFELALAPSKRLSAACALLRDLGAYIEESEAPGLVILKTRER